MQRRLASQVLFALGLILIWLAVTWFGLVESTVLPSFPDVARAVLTIPSRPEFLPALWGTVRDGLLGLTIAAVLAIPLGILVGMMPWLERTTRLLVDFGRSFPIIALLPILVLLFGATALMKVIAIAIACFFPILLQTIYGARRLERTMMETVRAYRIPFRLLFLRVLLPASGPYIATGLRIATTVAILVSVGVEIVSLTKGLGSQISLSRTYNETDAAFAYIVYAGLLGVLVTAAFDGLERRFLGWHLRSSSE